MTNGALKAFSEFVRINCLDSEDLFTIIGYTTAELVERKQLHNNARLAVANALARSSMRCEPKSAEEGRKDKS